MEVISFRGRLGVSNDASPHRDSVGLTVIVTRRVDSVENTVIAQVLAVNVAGTILCARDAVKRMSTRHGGSGGAIVNISSLVTRTGGAGEWVHYAASKGAVNSFTVGLAREVAAENIRVNGKGVPGPLAELPPPATLGWY
jgi:NAD(P)-dependent dehydrogenase (short-subunit alcohol dehydrogenase family)